MRILNLICVPLFSAIMLTAPSYATSMPMVNRLECLSESLMGCMNKLSDETGFTVSVPAEYADKVVYLLAEKITIDKCIGRAMDAAGCNNFAVEYFGKNQLILVVSMNNKDILVGRNAGVRTSLSSVVTSQQQVKQVPPASVDRKAGSQASAPIGLTTPVTPTSASDDGEATEMQVSASQDQFVLSTPRLDDVIVELEDGRKVTYGQIEKAQEEARAANEASAGFELDNGEFISREKYLEGQKQAAEMNEKFLTRGGSSVSE